MNIYLPKAKSWGSCSVEPYWKPQKVFCEAILSDVVHRILDIVKGKVGFYPNLFLMAVMTMSTYTEP